MNWEDIAELRFDQNENSWTVPSMNRLPSNIPLTEEAGAATLVVEPNNVQTCITYDTINGQVVITIPCDINSFFNNEEKRNDLLKALIMLSGDKNATIAKIEQGSIKITFNLSPDGIKRLEEEPDKILLMARIISISKGEELDLSDTDLSGVDLSGVDLSGADLSGADLSGAYLRDADLSDADLSDANLRDAYLSDAYLSGSDLSGANLSDADLSGGDLSGAYLRDANLRDANLRDADLSGANLSGAYLSGANLSGANVKNARFGNNPGIDEYAKRELKQRGAIFEDSQGNGGIASSWPTTKG
ncbi:pentapeptide repeat-containing protein [Dolichospermum sp. ST_con]|nr:pentapeptide repeat-containing protein [Dolichospermum sp. ST_con]